MAAISLPSEDEHQRLADMLSVFCSHSYHQNFDAFRSSGNDCGLTTSEAVIVAVALGHIAQVISIARNRFAPLNDNNAKNRR
jgi:hypothetical protein